MVEQLVDVRGAQLLAFGHEQETVGGVDAFGENHAGAEFAEEDFAFFARHAGAREGTEEGAHGFGIERAAAAEFDFVDDGLVFEGALGVGNGDREQATEPRDCVAAETIRITFSVVAFVVRADDGTEIF